jgi:hypothetical protein
LVEMGNWTIGRKGEPEYLGTQIVQPQRKPRTFESGVASDEYPFPAELGERCYQSFQGGLSLVAIESSSVQSR